MIVVLVVIVIIMLRVIIVIVMIVVAMAVPVVMVMRFKAVAFAVAQQGHPGDIHQLKFDRFPGQVFDGLFQPRCQRMSDGHNNLGVAERPRLRGAHGVAVGGCGRWDDQIRFPHPFHDLRHQRMHGGDVRRHAWGVGKGRCGHEHRNGGKPAQHRGSPVSVDLRCYNITFAALYGITY